METKERATVPIHVKKVTLVSRSKGTLFRVGLSRVLVTDGTLTISTGGVTDLSSLILSEAGSWRECSPSELIQAVDKFKEVLATMQATGVKQQTEAQPLAEAEVDQSDEAARKKEQKVDDHSKLTTPLKHETVIADTLAMLQALKGGREEPDAK